MLRKRRRFGEILSIGAWSIALAVCIVAGIRFETKPGTLGSAADPWPTGTAIGRSIDRPTLLLFAHPFCPCTRATLAELERALAHCANRVDARVVISWEGATLPADEPSIEELARAIPGATVVNDAGAQEARRFGASTSGEVFLYEISGRLAFHGGITAARGDEGDNFGRDALVARVMRDGPASSAAPATAPVFGCPLFGPAGVESASSRPLSTPGAPR